MTAPEPTVTIDVPVRILKSIDEALYDSVCGLLGGYIVCKCSSCAVYYWAIDQLNRYHGRTP